LKLIGATSEYKTQNIELLPYYSGTKENAVKKHIKSVYSFFQQVVLGLPGKSADEQKVWLDALTRFLTP
jgi:hypothetical protein